MSFLANEPADQALPPQQAIVTNDGFFPDIDMKRVRELVRLDGTVTEPRLREAVVAAMIDINGELADWKARQLLAGVRAVAELEPKIDGQPVALKLYLAALHSTVRANLNEKYRNYDATKSGLEEAEKLESMVDNELRAARWAISSILGKRRTTVELI